MFLSYYGLDEQPFGVTPDPRFLYQGEVHREALASLIYAIEAGLGFSSLIAEPGTGKTTLLYYLLQYYRDTASTAFLFDQQCDSRQLLRNLLVEFEIDAPDADVVVSSNLFREFLLEQRRARRRVLVVLDEAQNFSDAVLESVRLLSNFETPGAKLLHIILSGQPQLAAKLLQPELLNVRQRISMATRLRPFAPLDVARYIAHRLKVAGFAGGELFMPDALAAVARLSGGVPREINRICFNALSIGCALELSHIPPSVVEEASRDFDFGALMATDRGDEHAPTAANEFADAFAAEFDRAPAAAPPPDVQPATYPDVPEHIAIPILAPAFPATASAANYGAAACPVRETASAGAQLLPPDRTSLRRWRWLGVPAVAVLALVAIGLRLGPNHAPAVAAAATQPALAVTRAPVLTAKLPVNQETAPTAKMHVAVHRRHRRTVGERHAHSKPDRPWTAPDDEFTTIDQPSDVAAVGETAGAPAADSDDEISGEVVMNVTVDKYGHVQSVEPLAGPESLRQVAADKVRQWIFQPRVTHGEPHPMQVRVRVWATR